jgi:hypothetical protein
LPSGLCDQGHFRYVKCAVIILVVFTHTRKTRFLALFVIAFVCLNAGGAVCVAYCQSAMPVDNAAEHCPLKKADSHCNKGKVGTPSDATAVAGDEIFCCSVTVGFLPAPVEKSFRVAQIVQTAVDETSKFEPRFVLTQTFVATFDYRGPPPLDRRIERIKHRLLLI